MRFMLAPGDLVCDLAGTPRESDHRQVLRSLVNIVVWGAVGTAAALAMML